MKRERSFNTSDAADDVAAAAFDWWWRSSELPVTTVLRYVFLSTKHKETGQALERTDGTVLPSLMSRHGNDAWMAHAFFTLSSSRSHEDARGVLRRNDGACLGKWQMGRLVV